MERGELCWSIPRRKELALSTPRGGQKVWNWGGSFTMKSFSHLLMPHNSNPLCVQLGILIFRASQGKIRPLNSKSSGANVHLLAWKRVPFCSKQTILWRAIISISGRRLKNKNWRWEFSMRRPRGVRRSSWGMGWYFSCFCCPAFFYTRSVWIPCHVGLRLRSQWRWIFAHTSVLIGA